VNKDGIAFTDATKCSLNNSIVTTISHDDDYVRLGNGIQICWGLQATNTTNFDKSITLPQPYKNTSYSILLGITSAIATYSSVVGNLNILSHSQTTTEFNVKASGDVGFYYITIGYY